MNVVALTVAALAALAASLLAAVFTLRDVRARRETAESIDRLQSALKEADNAAVALRAVLSSRVELSGLNLEGMPLRGVILRERILRGADLRRADLTDADLSEADLSQARLAGANLSRARLIHANLTEADLTDCHMPNVNLNRAIAVRANLRGADLSGADLTNADLTDALLSNANLRGSDVTGANLRGALLQGANLAHLRLQPSSGRAQLPISDSGTVWPSDFDIGRAMESESVSIRPTIVAPVYWIIDCSASMSGSFVEAANVALEDVIDSLASNPQRYASIWISVISFSDKAELVLGLRQATDILEVPRLKAKGGTYYSPAFRLLADAVRADGLRLNEAGLQYGIPTVIFITDGTPNDSPDQWESALSDVRNVRTIRLYAYGLGSADPEVLARIGDRSFIAESELGPGAFQAIADRFVQGIAVQEDDVDREAGSVYVEPSIAPSGFVEVVG